MMVPYSLDMYTPVVPELPYYFGTTAGAVNLTILCFFLFFALSILAFGPLSDKFGRKPILLLGLSLYVTGSALCALAEWVWALVAFRVVQAVGAGTVVSVTTALVKDSFEPSRRARILALLQMLQVVGPVAAPLIGGMVLLVATWHMTFWVLALLGLSCLVLSLRLKETLPPAKRTGEGVVASIARLGVVAKDPAFDVFLVVMALFSVPFMAYVATASYVYIDGFGLSQQAYTYFFALTAALTVLGPITYLRLSHLVSVRALIGGFIVASAGAAVVMLAWGDRSPWVFCICMLVFAVCEATIRPCGVNILLSQRDGDAGSASSLINFTANLFGVMGMALIVAPWPSFTVGLGVLMLACMAVALVLFAAVTRGPSLRLRGL